MVAESTTLASPPTAAAEKVVCEFVPDELLPARNGNVSRDTANGDPGIQLRADALAEVVATGAGNARSQSKQRN